MKTTKTLRRMAVGTAAGVLALVGTMVSAGTAQADYSAGSTLNEPGILYQGGYLSYNDTKLILQGDGNLVIYKGYSYPTAVWAAPGTWGCGQKAIMQGDGNFVVYGANNRVCWASNSFKSSSTERASVSLSDHGGVDIVFEDTRFESFGRFTIRSSDPY
ncbi:D-mannose binding lectin [Streptomyces sp. 1114.5]|nr:D-mannose binding lectin [Streptomyces sp. 1114.5]SOB82461.1 D-mannose binding lectin [Streptomyces sp. 1331.2]